MFCCSVTPSFITLSQNHLMTLMYLGCSTCTLANFLIHKPPPALQLKPNPPSGAILFSSLLESSWIQMGDSKRSGKVRNLIENVRVYRWCHLMSHFYSLLLFCSSHWRYVSLRLSEFWNYFSTNKSVSICPVLNSSCGMSCDLVSVSLGFVFGLCTDTTVANLTMTA